MRPLCAAALRPSRLSGGLRLAIVLLVLAGLIQSAVGAQSSHGLAELAHSFGLNPTPHEGLPETQQPVLDAYEHAHHVADHFHDKENVPPLLTIAAARDFSASVSRADRWIERLRGGRLDRPPRA